MHSGWKWNQKNITYFQNTTRCTTHTHTHTKKQQIVLVVENNFSQSDCDYFSFFCGFHEKKRKPHQMEVLFFMQLQKQLQ